MAPLTSAEVAEIGTSSNTFHHLESLGVGLSPLSDPKSTARFLSRLCPLDCDVWAGATWPCGFQAASSVEARRTDEKWLEVAGSEQHPCGAHRCRAGISRGARRLTRPRLPSSRNVHRLCGLTASEGHARLPGTFQLLVRATAILTASQYTRLRSHGKSPKVYWWYLRLFNTNASYT